MKKTCQVVSLFMLFGSTSVKAERKYVGEIEPSVTIKALRNCFSIDCFAFPSFQFIQVSNPKSETERKSISYTFIG